MFSIPLSSTIILCFYFLFNTVHCQNNKCENPKTRCDSGDDLFPEKIKIEFANQTITELKYQNNFVDFTIRGTGDDNIWKYRVVPCGCSTSTADSGRQVLSIDPSRVFIAETPILSAFNDIVGGTLTSLAYVGTASNIYNPNIRAYVGQGNAISIDGDYSILAKDSNLSLSILGKFQKDAYVNASVDAPFLVAVEQDEPNALARAEWLKIVGLIFNRPKEATERFNTIKDRYNEIKKEASRADKRPSVFFNTVRSAGAKSKDINKRYVWTQPGGDQYIVDLVEDANGVYRRNEANSDEGDELNIDAIVKEFGSARKLIQVGEYPANSELKLETWKSEPIKDLDGTRKADSELTAKLNQLAAVRCGEVYSSMKKVANDGKANDFFESSIFKPDDVLADFVKILHPDLDFDHDTVYATRLIVDESKITDCPFPSLLEPATGQRFVEQVFKAPGKSRFEVEDGYIATHKELQQKLNVSGGSVDLLFFGKDEEKNDPEFLIRASMPNSTGPVSMEQQALPLLQRSIGNSVEAVNGTGISGGPSAGNNEEKDDDGGGLSGGAIAAIVIAVLIVAGLVGFFAFRKKKSGVGAVRPGGDQYWGGESAAIGNDDGGGIPGDAI